MDPRLAHALEGRYTIDREIGRGGMATVYLARDERHKRNVALKVLNPELGAVLGVERFLAEIQVTANLQHPNLLPLFDSGEASGLLFYVMPYVEGESLRARLEREKQLPVEEAVRITVAIAGALDYAHRHQVIHRDLKPENILMQEGQPLIADFGIALAVSNAGGARITQTGLSLGTPQYMSPEQATGDRVVDGRTDIYSLGAMLYEMLVGDPPHSASTAQAIIAKVLTERPRSVRSSRPNVPGYVDAAIGRALEKLAADRFGTAKEFADALSGSGTATRSGSAYADSALIRQLPSTRSTLRESTAWSLTILLAAGLAWSWLRPRPAEEAPVVRARFDLPPLVRVHDVLSGPTIAVSPNGDVVAYVWLGPAGFGIHARHVNELEPRELSNLGGRNLTFSPDGRFLAFTEGNVLLTVPIEGGAASTVATTAGAVPYGLSWSTNDSIYVGSFSGLRTFAVRGGSISDVPRLDSLGAQVGQRFPLVLPGGKAIVVSTGNGASEPPRLAVVRINSREETRFPIEMAAALGMIGDQLVFVTPSGALRAVRFDLDALEPVGDPVQLGEGLLVDPTAGVKGSLSQTGTLVYLTGRAEFEPQLVSPGASGGRPLVRNPGAYASPRLSPDGTRMAITLFGATSTDIWVYNLGRNTMERVTTEGANLRPEWSADGRYLVFVSIRDGRQGVWRQRSDGSEPAELLFFSPEVEPFEAILSPDDRWLVIRTGPSAKYPRDVLLVPLIGERTPRVLVGGPFTESMPRISPDGRWLAYQSSQTGRFEIYVRPFPGSGAPVQVSEGGASEPIWGRDGLSLYYRNPRAEFIRAIVTTGARFSIGARSLALTGEYMQDATHSNYDVAADGRFLVLKRSGPPSQPIIVHNWGRELREKTARP